MGRFVADIHYWNRVDNTEEGAQLGVTMSNSRRTTITLTEARTGQPAVARMDRIEAVIPSAGGDRTLIVMESGADFWARETPQQICEDIHGRGSD